MGLVLNILQVGNKIWESSYHREFRVLYFGAELCYPLAYYGVAVSFTGCNIRIQLGAAFGVSGIVIKPVLKAFVKRIEGSEKFYS